MSRSTLPFVPSLPVGVDGAPLVGTFQGEPRQVNLQALSGGWKRSRAQQLFRRKRWNYALCATPEVLVACAVTNVGYAANAFVTVLDLQSGEVLADESMMGMPLLQARVNDAPGPGLHARFKSRSAEISVVRGASDASYQLTALSRGRTPVAFHATLHTQGAAPAISVVSPVDGSRVNFTQKSNGLPLEGTLEVGGRRFNLQKGVGGMDYTQGDLAWHTTWRWAFSMGRLADGRLFGLNLVEGFNSEDSTANENALWLGTQLIPLSRARFTYDERNLKGEWHVKTMDGVVDLRFQPLAIHREDRNYGLVVSRFAQPLGHFEGTLKVEGESLAVTRMPGCTERQDMRW